MNRRRSSRPERAAFTLMEVLLVLVILVVLGSLAVNMFSGTRKQANVDAAKALIGTVEHQLPLYELHVGEMPQGLDALRNNVSNHQRWSGPYLSKDPIDPWGNLLMYQYPSTRLGPDRADIWSMGPDQASGTEDDIYNE